MQSVLRGRQLPPPRRMQPPERPPRWRWVRQASVREVRTWRPWWLLGLVEVIVFPRPRWQGVYVTWRCRGATLGEAFLRLSTPCLRGTL